MKNPLIIAFGIVIISFHVTGQQLSDTPSTKDLKKLSVEELMNVEVTSVSKRSEKLTTVASAVQVITREDIRQSGVTSLPEALRLASNLQVAQVNASQWAISARGFNNVLANKLLVLIDGRAVYTPMHAGVFWDVQNVLLEDVDRIEVISGPGGTLWGANAVNGVINIITKKSKDTLGTFVDAGIGTELPGLANLRYGGKFSDDLSYRVYGTTFKRDDTRLIDSTHAHDSWTMAQAGFRVDWEAPGSNDLMIQANLYSNRPDPDGGSPVLASGENVIVQWLKSFSKNSDIKFQFYYDKTWRDFRNDFTEKLKTYDFDGQQRFLLTKHNEIMWGLGARFMEHNVENLELFAFLPARKKLHLYSAYIQDEFKMLHDQLRFTLGSKIEHSNYAGFQYMPNARLAWTTKHQTLWTSVSRAIRNPARIDREFVIALAPEFPIIQGGDVLPEKLLAYELGWRLQTKTGISLSISTFYNVYDNLRSAEPNGALVYPITFGNGVKGDTYGIELSVNYQITDWWKLRGGYAFLKKDLSIKKGSSDLNQGTAESNDPEHQCLVQSFASLPGDIELGTVFRYIAKLPKPSVDGYAELDFRIGWKITKNLELSFVGQNLLNEAHVEFVPSSPSAREIERSVYGKITARF